MKATHTQNGKGNKMEIMKNLSENLVNVMRSFLKGAKLAKFNASVDIINQSLAQGAWISRGSVKAGAGFGNGITAHINFKKGYGLDASKAEDDAWELAFCLNYGQAQNADLDIDSAISILRAAKNHKDKAYRLPSDEVIKTWVALCAEKELACKFLDIARPVPVITEIGLSPKVTKTLKDMNLDIDLASIRPAKIVVEYVESFDKYNKPILVAVFRVEWTKGIVHGQSRFADHGCNCHACGKYIPSGQFVPIEAMDNKSGNLVAMWIGRDCASNIFGVKDVGLEKKD